MLFSEDLFTLSSSDRLSIFLAIDKNASSSSPSRFCLKPQRSYGWILTQKNKAVLHTSQNEFNKIEREPPDLLALPTRRKNLKHVYQTQRIPRS